MSIRRVLAIAGLAVLMAAPTGVTHAAPDPEATLTAQVSARAAPPVTGLIVLRKAGSEPVAPRLATRVAVRSVRASTRIADSRTIGSRVEVVRFDEPISDVDSQAMAAALERLPDVVSVSPDLPIMSPRPQAGSVTTTADPPAYPWHLYTTQFHGASVTDVLYAGFKGQGVVVAVIDSGVIAHADFGSKLLPGYDFIEDVWVANDGDGWDADASDPGDAITQADRDAQPQRDCVIEDSTWHGTEVTSLIVGQGDGYTSLQGVAPDLAGVVPVRALGRCGGSVSSLLAGITWASGGTVTGVPANAHPARIINMSLAASLPCDDIYASVVREARGRGSLIVAAAGNHSSFVSQAFPANCPGVVSVGALDQDGLLAEYTNVGDDALDVTLMAPGGDSVKGIPVATNSGLTSPGVDAYATTMGTSFAAPIVAGAAALIASTGVTDPDLLEAHLKAATSAPPSGDASSAPACSPNLRCGAGRLDLRTIFSHRHDVAQPQASRERPAAPVVRVSSWKRAGKHRQVTLTWDSPTSAAVCRRALAPGYQAPVWPDNDLAGLWNFQVAMSRDSGASFMRLLIKQKKCTGRRFTTIFKALPSTRSVVMVRSFRSQPSNEDEYQASDWTSVKLRSPA